MTVVYLSTPEILFGILVLTCFVTFIVTLAGTHIYTILSPRAPAKTPQLPERRLFHPVEPVRFDGRHVASAFRFADPLTTGPDADAEGRRGRLSSGYRAAAPY